jgi:hypothetical protein
MYALVSRKYRTYLHANDITHFFVKRTRCVTVYYIVDSRVHLLCWLYTVWSFFQVSLAQDSLHSAYDKIQLLNMMKTADPKTESYKRLRLVTQNSIPGQS